MITLPTVQSDDGLFHDGDPSQGEVGTIVTADWLNAVQSYLSSITFVDAFVGVPLPYPSATPPDGFLAMKGQSLDPDSYPILHGLYGDNLPDLRGEFVRGWDGGRGVDVTRELLSWQKASLSVAGNKNESVWFQFFYQNQISPNLESFGFDAFDAADYPSVFRADIIPARVGYSAATLSPAGVGASRPRNLSFNYICLAA